ncbi:MAG: CHASE2 domain-containing protein [Gallionella sp.]|nr:CHASE2 domain-containing protein [Gallionella sp.]OIO10061.1 MAG: serine/threonine protein kinase [Gallionellaceae bacterium CG1_02_60_325]PIR09686.1 MAG: serine/threonine protein kinase [Gallionellaceae bacterium CG11_big_fil_rev_8_21_14_0_20_60_62]
MKKTSFWKADWFFAAVLAVVFLFGANTDLIQSLERKAYDWGVRASSRQPSDRIAIIAIDEPSIANLGRWPWPREIQAKLVDILAEGHAKVVGQTALFFEPQVDPGLDYILNIAAVIEQTDLAQTHPEQWLELQGLMQEALLHLDNDQKMADSMGKINNVLLGLYFELGEPQGNPDAPLPDYVLKNALSNVQAGADAAVPIPAFNALVPIPLLGQRALAMGHLNATPDVDGGVRTEPLVISYYDQYYPSLSLMLAAKSLNLEAKDIQVTLGEGVRLGNLQIATDPALRMNTYFYADRDGRPAFQVDSFYDVITGKIPAEKYRDKIVLIGATAAGVGSVQVTPVSAVTPPVLTLAHSVSSILKQDFFVTPTWSVWAELATFLLIALYLILLLPRLGAGFGAAITGILFVALLSAHFVLMTTQAMWLQLMLPAALLLAGHLMLTTKRFLLTEKGKEKSDAESAESNRMLGLAFQGQGQLDMAFDKFRKVPLDDSLMDVLYNLGLDFERKRQFNKAESVFKYMADHNPKFRDLEARTAQSKAMAETVILGGSSGRGNDSTMKLDQPGLSRPMLGRYEIQKELGKGAMGVVYLGKDPKISRIVAIKTMNLSQEFEADELEEVKARFFREAETAGRLNHPNIVTMYDAGEEHDLAYIAMEFLKGKDLVPYTKPDNLLPLPKVLSIAARVADALGYAHSLHVVHRDIKPANIMYDPESDTVKVTDFGIARITDSSKTKTGMVLGTPSYMSPEQLSGAKIEGHSDLFSLGVSLYQLACGKLPFAGDSMAQLMFRIANEPPADILSIKPDLPPCVVAIIQQALVKKVEERFESGAAMALAIRQCAAALAVSAQGESK